MLVVHNYLFSPGCCGLCRSVNLPTIDTGIDLDYPNSPDDPNPSAMTRFYICADCGIELARMVLPDRNLELNIAGTRGSLEAVQEQIAGNNTALAARVEELESALRVVKAIPPVQVPEPPAKPFKVAAPKEPKI
jgi:hypothetical protein